MPRISKFASIFAAAAIAVTAPAALAQDKPPRDSTGTVMDLSKWHDMPTHEFMLNIVDLPGVEMARAQRRVRNKGIPHERVRFGGGKGWMLVEHIYVGLYNEHVTDSMQSREEADRAVERRAERRRLVTSVEQRRKIYAFGERGGWVYAVRVQGTGQLCIAGRFGFLSDWGKMGHRTGERYDTSVIFNDCSGKRSLDDMVAWANGAKIVEPPYNRIAGK